MKLGINLRYSKRFFEKQKSKSYQIVTTNTQIIQILIKKLLIITSTSSL